MSLIQSIADVTLVNFVVVVVVVVNVVVIVIVVVVVVVYHLFKISRHGSE